MSPGDAVSARSSNLPQVKQEETALPAIICAPGESAVGQTAAPSSGARECQSTSAIAHEEVKTEGEQPESKAAVETGAADEFDSKEAKYHELFLETLRKDRLKESSRSRSGGFGDGDGGQAQPGEDEEEEEVLLYSDHEEEEEEAAHLADADTKAAENAAASNQGKPEDDNDAQAKEQLANLSYFDLVKVSCGTRFRGWHAMSRAHWERVT